VEPTVGIGPRLGIPPIELGDVEPDAGVALAPVDDPVLGDTCGFVLGVFLDEIAIRILF
jgi:hypothetical protein